MPTTTPPKERPTVIYITAGQTKHNTSAIVSDAEDEDKRLTKLAAQAGRMGHRVARVDGGFCLSAGACSTHFDDLDVLAKLIRRMARGPSKADLYRMSKRC